MGVEGLVDFDIIICTSLWHQCVVGKIPESVGTWRCYRICLSDDW